jgi:excisionase family DNA binding protein
LKLNLGSSASEARHSGSQLSSEVALAPAGGREKAPTTPAAAKVKEGGRQKSENCSMTGSPIDPLVEAIAQRTAEILRRDLGLETKRLFTVEQAAEYLGRTPYAIRHMKAKGELAGVQRGDNRVFFDREDLDHWIEMSKGGR